MLQNVVNKTGTIKWVFIVGIAGILLGILAGNLTKRFYIGESGNFDLLFLANIKTVDIDHLQLFWMTAWKHVKGYLFIWIFSVTIFWQAFGILFPALEGFLAGFLLSVTTVLYGFKGIVLILAYYMPQTLIYVPVFLAALVKGYEINRRTGTFGYGQNGGRRKLLTGELPVFFLLMAGLLAGCFLEAYVNVWLVKKAATLF